MARATEWFGIRNTRNAFRDRLGPRNNQNPKKKTNFCFYRNLKATRFHDGIEIGADGNPYVGLDLRAP